MWLFFTKSDDQFSKQTICPNFVYLFYKFAKIYFKLEIPCKPWSSKYTSIILEIRFMLYNKYIINYDFKNQKYLYHKESVVGSIS
jgi:hypothetical protein